MSMTMELKCCPFCGGEAESDSRRGYRNISTGNPENAAAIYCTKCSADMTWCYRDTPEIERDHVMKLLIEQWNTRATASLQGEDAVERVAHAVTSEFGRMYKDGVPICMREGETTWRTYYAGFDLSQFAQRITDAILATGLAPDEAAIRADWHTTGWDRARNSGRILLVWREFAGVSEHVELGRYSDAKAAWVNTYGHQFHAEPDGWAPLLPFKTAEAIRADEREKCAKVADERAEKLRVKAKQQTKPNGNSYFHQAIEARVIAAAIRSNGRCA